MNDTTITITGNVGTPPEQKLTSTGVPLTRFRVACTERRFDRTAGIWVDGVTSWYAVSMFRELAEHAFGSLAKGDRVIVTGRLRIKNWENGVKQGTDAEIEADAIGHDLRWGTTRFERSRRPQASVEQPADDAWSTETRSERVLDRPAPHTGAGEPAAWNGANSPADPGQLSLATADVPF